jgi:hypothetical protein
LVVFPQARQDENWRPEFAEGKRALAILKQVQSDYREAKGSFAAKASSREAT